MVELATSGQRHMIVGAAPARGRQGRHITAGPAVMTGGHGQQTSAFEGTAATAGHGHIGFAAAGAAAAMHGTIRTGVGSGLAGTGCAGFRLGLPVFDLSIASGE